MDFHQLRVFLEVAKQKSFSRAAEVIFLSQPTVSAHIKSLETEIGVPLLDRCQRELQLTKAGKILFQYAHQLLDIKKKALFTIQEKYRIVEGHLELAASSVPGAYILPGLMKSFLEQHPQVTFALTLHDTGLVYQQVCNYTHSLGFVGEPAPVDELEQIELAEDELVLVTDPGTELEGKKSGPGLPEIDLKSDSDFETFIKLPFILREPGSATRTLFEKAIRKFNQGQKVPLNTVAYLESQEAIKEAVKAGLGVTVISQQAVQEELAGGLMKGYRLPDLQLQRYFYLIYRKNRIFSPLTQAFLDHCRTYFAAEDE